MTVAGCDNQPAPGTALTWVLSKAREGIQYVEHAEGHGDKLFAASTDTQKRFTTPINKVSMLEHNEAFREEPVIEAAMSECKAGAVVVEGPGGDAKFLSEWVAASVKVQAAWDMAGEGPDGKLYNEVFYGELIHFGLWAIDFISRLRRSRRAVAVVLPFTEFEESHYFALMVGLGFFEPAADHYRMVVPNDFHLARLKTTAMYYLAASLTDSEGTNFLFPHRIITTMSVADAEALQERLIAIDQFEEDNRCDIATRETAAPTGIATCS